MRSLPHNTPLQREANYFHKMPSGFNNESHRKFLSKMSRRRADYSQMLKDVGNIELSYVIIIVYSQSDVDHYYTNKCFLTTCTVMTFFRPTQSITMSQK
jgi:hypothetical protein